MDHDDGYQLSEREKKLIDFGRRLDPAKRHRVTVVFRGQSPWQIEEHITESKLVLIPDKQE